MELSLIIPTYNEAENLPRLVSALFALPLPDLRLLIVDDHSPDGTGQIAEALARRYIGRLAVIHRPAKLGLGTAYLQAFRVALEQGCQAVGQMDADFSHDPARLPALLAALADADLVIGSRYVPGGSVDVRWPFWRKALSAFGNWYARTILGVSVRDLTGGYRLWRAEAVRLLLQHDIRSTGYAYQVETAYLAVRHGLRIREVPIYFADRKWGKSKMSLRIQVEAALRVWQIKWRYRQVVPQKPG